MRRPYPSRNPAPTNLTSFGGYLYFQASDGSNGDELWKSDGTSSGTTVVKDIYPGSLFSSTGKLGPVSLDVGQTEERFWRATGYRARIGWSFVEMQRREFQCTQEW
jgi:ELWxxDGT repeat protein